MGSVTFAALRAAKRLGKREGTIGSRLFAVEDV
jgi:hypothetical protein